MSSAGRRRDVAAAAFLAVLTVAIDAPLTLQGRVLASFDALVYFYPNAAYLAFRLGRGELPLWNPYLFAGVPFLANSQVGALYPPNWLDLALPVSRAYSWLVVGHVWWLALGVYALGRLSLGLSRPAALFASIAIAFGGFVGGMAGHLNQIEALAWTPLAVLASERGIARGSARIALVAAIPIAFAALAGHSQVLYMTIALAVGVGLARLAECAVVDAARRRDGRDVSCDRSLGFWLGQVGLLLAGSALGLTLAAAQLVPTLELSERSIRESGLSFADAAAFSLPPPDLLIALLPTWQQAPSSTEWLGYLALSALVLAGVGLWRRPAPEAIALAVVAGLGLLLALGHYTPLYGAAFEVVPAFRLFRVPARWLTFWTLGVGLLGGWGLDTVRRVTPSPAARSQTTPRAEPGPNGGERWPCWAKRSWLVGLVGLGAIVGIAGLGYWAYRVIVWPSASTLALWAITLLALGALFGLARRRRDLAVAGFLALAVAEVAVAAANLPIQQAVWPSAVEGRRLTVDHLIARGSADRILTLGDNTYDPGDLADLRQMLDDTLPPAAREQYVTAVKHLEGLTPNLSLRFRLPTIDGYDGGVLPLDRYRWLKQLFAHQGPDVADGRLRLQLRSAPDPTLLGWLNVRYLVMDRLRDRWSDGVYYDLGVSQRLEPGVPLTLSVAPPFPATGFGVILADGPAGAPPRGTLRLEGSGATAVIVDPPNAGGQHLDSDVDPAGLWLGRVSLARPTVVDRVTLSWSGDGPVTLRGLSAVDERTHASQSITVSPRYRLDLLGDLKVYENEAVRPRAFLADGLTVVPSLSDAVARLRDPSWQPSDTAVAAASDVAPGLAFQTSGVPGEATIVDEQPERVVVQTSAPGRRMLVLVDSVYPGWRATVDGAEVPILTVDLLFRGVIVPAGTHRIEFTYAPSSWRLGLAGNFVGLVVLLGGLGLPRRQGGAHRG